MSRSRFLRRQRVALLFCGACLVSTQLGQSLLGEPLVAQESSASSVQGANFAEAPSELRGENSSPALHARSVEALPASASREIFLDEVVRVDFSPSQAFFLVSIEKGSYLRIEATLVPPFKSEVPKSQVSAAGGATKVQATVGSSPVTRVSSPVTRVSSPVTLVGGPWRAGARVTLPPSAGRFTYSVIVVGEGNRFALLPPREVMASDAKLFGGETDALREYLLKRKQEARSWQTQIDAQDDSLRRLRADADIVADLSRIVEVREDIDRVRQSIRGLQQDQANLEEFLRLARTGPQPRNFASRERQLTKQIVELADVAKGTESGEFSRRSDAEREVQQQLALIEQARGLDLDGLQRELVQLRKLKRDLGGALSPGETAQEETIPAEKGATGPLPEGPEDYVQ